ncbi:hypothetical protein SALWKB12_2058 [Snodgrassella communis]|nr:hypothetical protein SALWKB12_2058 [Snodgrassella communis]
MSAQRILWHWVTAPVSVVLAQLRWESKPKPRVLARLLWVTARLQTELEVQLAITLIVV